MCVNAPHTPLTLPDMRAGREGEGWHDVTVFPSLVWGGHPWGGAFCVCLHPLASLCDNVAAVMLCCCVCACVCALPCVRVCV